jgi:hypothetical protein
MSYVIGVSMLLTCAVAVTGPLGPVPSSHDTAGSAAPPKSPDAQAAPHHAPVVVEGRVWLKDAYRYAKTDLPTTAAEWAHAYAELAREKDGLAKELAEAISAKESLATRVAELISRCAACQKPTGASCVPVRPAAISVIRFERSYGTKLRGQRSDRRCANQA